MHIHIKNMLYSKSIKLHFSGIVLFKKRNEQEKKFIFSAIKYFTTQYSVPE